VTAPTVDLRPGFTALFEQNRLALLLVAEGTELVLLGNTAAAQLLGFAHAVALNGLSLDELLAGGDARAQRARARMGATEQGDPQLLLPFRRADGSSIWCSTLTSPIEHEGRPLQLWQISDASAAMARRRQQATRMGELDCLHGFMALAERPDVSEDDLCAYLLTVLPPLLQWPGHAAVRVVLGGREWRGAGFAEGGPCLAESLADALGDTPDHDLAVDPPTARDRLAQSSTGEPSVARGAGQTEGQVQGDRLALHYSPLLASEPGIADVPLFLEAERRLLASLAAHLRRWRAQRRAVEYQRAMFDQAGVGMLIADADGVILDVNPSFSALLGSSRERLIGMSYADFTVDADLPANHAHMAATRSGQESGFRLTKRYRRFDDGRLVWVNLSVATVRDDRGGVRFNVGVVVDVTREKEAELTLKASEARYRTLLEALPVGILHVDAELRVRRCNLRAQQILQVSETQLLGLDLHAIRDRAAIEPAFVAALGGEIGHYHGPYISHLKGLSLWIELRTAPLRDPDGVIVGAVCAFEDMTQQHQAEQALQRSEAELRLLLDNLVDTFYRTDAKGRVVMMSPAVERRRGKPPEALLGRPLTELYTHPDGRRRFLEALTAAGPWATSVATIGPKAAPMITPIDCWTRGGPGTSTRPSWSSGR